MIKLKKALALLMILLLAIPMLCIVSGAADEDGWVYINGINITRNADTAIIYKGIASTGQTQWGHDLIVDSENKVTKIVEAGLAEGDDLLIPENCYVISAAGTKAQWFKSHVKKGDTLFFDSYTGRMFVCDKKGEFDPYFEVETAVTGERDYLIVAPETEGTPTYTYGIAVDENGTVVARGSGVTAPEKGFTLSASTERDKQFLITHALLGAKCKIEDSKATLVYDKDMLKDTLVAEIAISESLLNTAKESFYNIDIAAAEELIGQAKTASEGKLDYKQLSVLLDGLKNKIDRICVDSDANEVRAAFYSPEETDENAVREIVKKAKENGLNTLFLRVSNGYGTFISLPEGDRFKQDAKFNGFDVLEAYIRICREENISLGLSVDVYYNQYAAIAKSDWTTVTNGTEKGLADKYYSPASDEFKEYFADYVKFIVSKYDIDTLLLDYLRYPKFHENCDLGYDYDTLSEFSSKYGIPTDEANALATDLFKSPHWQKWVDFKTSLVTDMAISISESVRSARSDVDIIAISARDTVDYFYMQDTVQWLEDGIIDGVCLSLYERDPLENDAIDPLAYDDGLVYDKGEIISAYTGKNKYFFTVLESGKSLNADTVSTMIKESRSRNADGFIFGSLNEYIAQHYYSELSKDVMASPAISVIGNKAEIMRATLEYAKAKIDGYILANGGCDETAASNALSKINAALSELDKGVLTHAQASKLENDIALIFASSGAKQTVLKEFSAITKAALLYKEKDDTPPVTDESSNADDSSNIGNINDDKNASIVESEPSIPTVSERKKLDINIGNILMYGFVGLTTVVAIAGIIIAAKRKSQRPVNRHMPKASQTEESNEEE